MTRRWSGAALFACAAAVLGSTAAVMTSSCSQTPVNVPVRTFERAQKMDVVCIQVRDGLGVPSPPVGGFKVLPQSACAPVPSGVNGDDLPNHLIALVTQTTHGEIALVDLTRGAVLDIDPTTPGINFLPVGQIPTDVVVSPDGAMTFVAAAEVNKPAVYGVNNKLLPGEAFGRENGVTKILDLPSLPVCALPQAPGAMAIVPRPVAAPPPGTGDAGADAQGDAGAEADAGADAQADAEADAGADAEAGAEAGAGASTPSPYAVAVVLPGGDAKHKAQVILLDPADFLAGAGLGSSASGGYPPGQLAPCKPLSVIDLGASGALPAGFGPFWDDGVKYVDGGVTLGDATPAFGAECTATGDGGAAEAGADGGAAGPGLPPPHASGAALDVNASRTTLYVADDAQPFIYAIDVTDPSAPRFLEPLRATSKDQPERVVSVGAISISPPTHDYKRYLYAIDKKDGSIIVYDITDPVTSPKVPLLRPHPELNPFQPQDRLIFSVPVATLSFVRHDVPLQKGNAAQSIGGQICNPNPNVNLPAEKDATKGEQGPFKDDGATYRNDYAGQSTALGPLRLRGIFAFVTLSNGTIVTIDVDDWDAPCRRPDPMEELVTPDAKGQPPLDTTGPISAIAPPQPAPSGPDDTDPYHVPYAFQAGYTSSPVSNEAFFPVSAPHRARSFYLLRNDPSTGVHIPYLPASPLLYKQSSPLATDPKNGGGNPALLPTYTSFQDPTYVANPLEPNINNRETIDPNGIILPGSPPNVRFAFEDPQVQVDQDWAITYEGALPGFNLSISADVTPETPDYAAVVLRQSSAQFCKRGVEDFAQGKARAQLAAAELQSRKMPVPARADHYTTDYVQLTDDILDVSDGYWSEPNSCWDDSDPNQTNPTGRQLQCTATFGQTLDPNTPSTARDFPILEAWDDHLVVGTYGYKDASRLTSSREVWPSAKGDGRSPGNAAFLRLMQCCFHNQVHFNVRTGGEWVAQGSVSGYMHHVQPVLADGGKGRCVQSCDPRLALMNSRTVGVPRASVDAKGNVIGNPLIDRDSALALRNPMWAVVVWNGAKADGTTVIPDRDMVWKMSTRGQFVPQTISLQAKTTAVSPQSMRFIESLGQLALVDGSAEGLVLIDLNTVSFAHDPYF